MDLNGDSNTQVLFVCSNCDYTTGYKKDYHRHLLSKKHMKRVENKDVDAIYKCECCEFQTIYKYNYDVHVKSQKHLLKQNHTMQNIKENQCEFCRKIYSNSKNLWRHKKICKHKPTDESCCGADISDTGSLDGDCNDIEYNERHKQTGVGPITPELFMQMYKQNSDFQMLMMEQQKYILEKMETISSNNNHNHNHNNNTTNSNNSITMNNSNNKTFNIQFFLNEYCKNAIDIHDFVRSLNYSTENLEETMKLGYVGGISKMMTDKIRITPVEERPIHCCDEKREKLYIRNNGEWVSGNDSAEILQSIIADIANNNYRTFQQWVRENPSCMTLDTPAYEKYMVIYRGVIGSRTDDEETKHVKKILTNILHDIVIEKEKYLM